MAQVKRLDWDESVHVDGAFLGELVVELGVDGAQAVVNDAVEAMGADLAALDRAMDEGRMADVVALCDALARLAWEMGLTPLSGVAVDLAICAENGDLTALAAIHGRMQRIGPRSLVAAWDEAAIG